MPVTAALKLPAWGTTTFTGSGWVLICGAAAAAVTVSSAPLLVAVPAALLAITR